MSWFDYRDSMKIASSDPGFYGIIMAAMRKADTTNRHKLQSQWPGVWEELAERYNAPAGVLSTDPEGVWKKVFGETVVPKGGSK
jgi:hypothetical protein